MLGKYERVPKLDPAARTPFQVETGQSIISLDQAHLVHDAALNDDLVVTLRELPQDEIVRVQPYDWVKLEEFSDDEEDSGDDQANISLGKLWDRSKCQPTALKKCQEASCKTQAREDSREFRRLWAKGTEFQLLTPKTICWGLSLMIGLSFLAGHYVVITLPTETTTTSTTSITTKSTTTTTGTLSTTTTTSSTESTTTTTVTSATSTMSSTTTRTSGPWQCGIFSVPAKFAQNNAVCLSMDVNGIDYETLALNPDVYKRFEGAFARAIADLVGFSTRAKDVHVMLSKGDIQGALSLQALLFPLLTGRGVPVLARLEVAAMTQHNHCPMDEIVRGVVDNVNGMNMIAAEELEVTNIVSFSADTKFTKS